MPNLQAPRTVHFRHDPVRTEDNNGGVTVSDGLHRLTIEPDHEPESPREWSNLGKMVCWHSRHNLGDEQRRDNPSEWLREMFHDETGNDLDYNYGGNEERYDKAVVRWVDRNLVMLPLFLYDHSGLAMSTSSGRFRVFDSAGWDWGQVGFIYVTRANVLKEYSAKRLTKSLREKVLGVLRSEVEVYDQYLRGDIYGFTIETVDGEHINSCWGFYGHDPKKNGMVDHIEKKFRHLLEAI